jgi:hypothetical protein
MSREDSEARKARAARLREQIERLKADQQPAGAPDPPAQPESPRDFVERRMRETDTEQHDDQ